MAQNDITRRRREKRERTRHRQIEYKGGSFKRSHFIALNPNEAQIEGRSFTSKAFPIKTNYSISPIGCHVMGRRGRRHMGPTALRARREFLPPFLYLSDSFSRLDSCPRRLDYFPASEAISAWLVVAALRVEGGERGPMR